MLYLQTETTHDKTAVEMLSNVSGMQIWRSFLHRWQQQPRIWPVFPVPLKDRPLCCRHGALGLWDLHVHWFFCIDVQPTTNKTQSNNSWLLTHDTKGVKFMRAYDTTLLECVCVRYGFRVNSSCLWNLLTRKLMSTTDRLLMSATVLKASYFRGKYVFYRHK